MHFAMAEKGDEPPVCLRCQGGPKHHGGHQRQDPKCLLHGCTSNKARDIHEHIKQKQIEQAVLQALENAQQSSANPEARGNAPAATTSSTTATSPPPPPPQLRPDHANDGTAASRPRLRRTKHVTTFLTRKMFRMPSSRTP